MHRFIFGEKGGIRNPCGSPHANLFLSMRTNFLHFLALPVTLPAWNLFDSQFCDGDTRGVTPFHFSPKIFSLSCQFYTLKILVNIVCFIREKSYWISTLISLSKLMRKIPKDRLSSGERMVLWSSFMNVCCITWEGGSEWNRMVVNAKGGEKGALFNFFADIINHLPMRSTSRVANFAGIKFCASTL